MAIAYAASNLTSVVVGSLLGAALPTRAIGLGSGVLFLGFALWNLRDGDDEAGDRADEDGGNRSGAGWAAVTSVAAAMFVAELGDKTMLTVATLAAQGDPVFVWVGATVGICLSGGVGVLVGRSVGARLPARAIRIGSSGLFAAFGVALLVANL